MRIANLVLSSRSSGPVQVAVALGSDVHLYNAEAGVASTLCSLAEDDYVTSLSWSADGRHLAIGTYSHQVPPRPCRYNAFQN